MENLDIFRGVLELAEEKCIHPNEVRVAISKIRNAYSDKNQKTNLATSVEYNEKAKRSAYVYLFLTSHVNIVNMSFTKFFTSSRTLNTSWTDTIKKKKSIRVCSIGGGPGSDIFGLASFFKRDPDFRSVQIYGTVLDKFIEWKETADLLKEKFKFLNNLKEIRYEKFDFFKIESNALENIRNADIVTIVKFISAVAEDLQNCAEQLKRLLHVVSSNALVLFVDNAGGNYYELFHEQARKENLNLELMTNEKILISSNIKDLSRYISLDLTEYQPQCKARVVTTIWRKKPFDSIWMALSNLTFEDDESVSPPTA